MTCYCGGKLKEIESKDIMIDAVIMIVRLGLGRLNICGLVIGDRFLVGAFSMSRFTLLCYYELII